MAPSDGRVGKWLELGDFKRAFQRFQADEMTDRAAGLTYYSLLSLFPALLFGVAALGYFGRQGLITDAADYLREAGAPEETIDTVMSALSSAQSQRGTAFTALIVALAHLAVRRVGRVRRRRAGAQPRLAGGRGAQLRPQEGARHRMDAAPARPDARDLRADLRRRRASPRTSSARSAWAKSPPTCG